MNKNERNNNFQSIFKLVCIKKLYEVQASNVQASEVQAMAYMSTIFRPVGWRLSGQWR